MATTATTDFYLRYYIGHKGRFGHEFLEFEVRPDGMIRYANNSNYRREVLIRKEGKAITHQLAVQMTRERAVPKGAIAWQLRKSLYSSDR